MDDAAVSQTQYASEMHDYSHTVRKWVKPEDLNQHGALFGGKLLQWVDEEAAIIAVIQLGTRDVVTRYFSEVSFTASAYRGDLLELNYRVISFGRTSLSMECRVDNVVTGQEILTLERIVFVRVNGDGMPCPHGYSVCASDTSRLRAGGKG